jgi:transcriptional regulator with XRE-family HTH domain
MPSAIDVVSSSALSAQACTVVPMIVLRRELGEVLREERQTQGRSLRDVAKAASVSTAYLSEVERGTKEASSELIGAICSALGQPLSQVLSQVTSRVALAEAATAPVPLHERRAAISARNAA